MKQRKRKGKNLPPGRRKAILLCRSRLPAHPEPPACSRPSQQRSCHSERSCGVLGKPGSAGATLAHPWPPWHRGRPPRCHRPCPGASPARATATIAVVALLPRRRRRVPLPAPRCSLPSLRNLSIRPARNESTRTRKKRRCGRAVSSRRRHQEEGADTQGAQGCPIGSRRKKHTKRNLAGQPRCGAWSIRCWCRGRGVAAVQ